MWLWQQALQVRGGDGSCRNLGMKRTATAAEDSPEPFDVERRRMTTTEDDIMQVLIAPVDVRTDRERGLRLVELPHPDHEEEEEEEEKDSGEYIYPTQAEFISGDPPGPGGDRSLRLARLSFTRFHASDPSRQILLTVDLGVLPAGYLRSVTASATATTPTRKRVDDAPVGEEDDEEEDDEEEEEEEEEEEQEGDKVDDSTQPLVFHYVRIHTKGATHNDVDAVVSNETELEPLNWFRTIQRDGTLAPEDLVRQVFGGTAKRVNKRGRDAITAVRKCASVGVRILRECIEHAVRHWPDASAPAPVPAADPRRLPDAVVYLACKEGRERSRYALAAITLLMRASVARAEAELRGSANDAIRTAMQMACILTDPEIALLHRGLPPQSPLRDTNAGALRCLAIAVRMLVGPGDNELCLTFGTGSSEPVTCTGCGAKDAAFACPAWNWAPFCSMACQRRHAAAVTGKKNSMTLL